MNLETARSRLVEGTFNAQDAADLAESVISDGVDPWERAQIGSIIREHAADGFDSSAWAHFQTFLNAAEGGQDHSLPPTAPERALEPPRDRGLLGLGIFHRR
ncbi:MAG: hypothetical protein AAFX94_08475 [Myxococcota bacterium]